jgi:nucleotide-binding universal stress UspA family protein
MYRLILVPVDGSGAGTSGLDEAIKIAHHAGARLHLMNIVDDTAFRTEGAEGASNDASTALLSAVREQGEKVLRRAQARAEDAGVIAATALVRGGRDSLQALVARQAEESGADLIVLGTHASRSLSRLFMSQDLGHLHNLVSMPILLVRGEGSHDDVSVIEVAMSEPMALGRH